MLSMIVTAGIINKTGFIGSRRDIERLVVCVLLLPSV